MSKKIVFSVLSALVCSLGAAQQGLPDAGETEKRNAATSFVMSREMMLVQVYQECSEILKNSSLSMNDVAARWVVRNRQDLDAAAGWLGFYFSALKRDKPELFESESRALLREVANANERMIAVYFKGHVPDESHCIWAAKSYEAPLDFQSIASNPGYERFGEYPDTLRRIRNEPWHLVREPVEKRFEKSLGAAANQRSIALLAAANAAALRGDEKLRLSIFEKMAARKDGRAAQTVALAHYTGAPGYAQNFLLAFRWFYQAWSLFEPEGLNGMGVMVRDGLGVEKNNELAFAAFSVTKAMARSPDALARATSNVASVASSVSDEARQRVACMTLASLDRAFERQLPADQAVTLKRAFQSPERRLGEMSKDLAPYLAMGHCTEAHVQ